MPFQSEKQRRFLWAKHPDLARKWTQKYGPRPAKKDKHMDLKEVGKYGPGTKKAGEHYSKSFRDGPVGQILDAFSGKKAKPKAVARKAPKAPGFTSKEKTQAAGNAVKMREMARRNKNPGMTAEQANEMERHSGLMATLPKRTTTVSRAKPKSKKKG